MGDLFRNFPKRHGTSKLTLKRKIQDVQESCRLYFQKTPRRDSILSDNETQDAHNVVEVNNDFHDLVEEDQQVEIDNMVEQDHDHEEYPDEDRSVNVDTDLDSSSEEDLTEFNETNENADVHLQNLFPRERIENELLEWSLKYMTKNKPLSDLLKILKSNGLKVPLDARTLKRTPRNIVTKDVFPGKYWHYGIKPIVDLCIQNGIILPETLTLDTFIDGVSLYKSSKEQFYGILGRFAEIEEMKPFVIGIYNHMYYKPKDIQSFLSDFVTEMNELGAETYRGVDIVPGLFIMDAAALCAMKMIKQHNGYSSCQYCTAFGLSINRRMVFLTTDNEPRTDSSFRNREDPEHHNSGPGEITPLEKLDIDMIGNFPPDYLHCVCLGVVRKILYILTDNYKIAKNPYQTEIFDNTYLVGITISMGLSQLSKPRDIHRAIRPLSEVRDFKGTEFITFILYYGIVALNGNVDNDLYRHYLKLHCALTICLSDEYRHFLSIAEKLFIEYVEDYKRIYGFYTISYNVHELLHIVENVTRLGSLEHYSGFDFETEIGKVKHSVNSGNLPLHQVIKRTTERTQFGIKALSKRLKSGEYNFN